MKSVKIQTSKGSDFGKTICFGKKEIKFDSLGFAEVEDENVAKQLAADYQGWLFVGAVPGREDLPKKEDKSNEELQKNISKLEDKLESSQATVKALNKEIEDWKEQTDIANAKLRSKEFELSEYTTQTNKQIEELKLNIELQKKTSKELIEICVTLGIEEDSYKGLNKDELVKVILDESRK